MKNPLCIKQDSCVNASGGKSCKYETAAKTCVQKDGPQTVWQLKKENKKLKQLNPQRLMDLVRWARCELHKARLINDEEYAMLLTDNEAVARLETYDELRAHLEKLEE